MRRAAILAVCGFLAACATHAGDGPPKVVIQTVNMPVVVPCSTDAGDKPELADPKTFRRAVKAAHGIFALSQVYVATVQEAFDWIARLEAANAGCRAK